MLLRTVILTSGLVAGPVAVLPTVPFPAAPAPTTTSTTTSTTTTTATATATTTPAPSPDPAPTDTTVVPAPPATPGTTAATAAPSGAGASVMCGDLPATIVANASGVIRGTSGPDVIVGTAGNDRILADAGDDVVCSGGGVDTLLLGAGTDHALIRMTDSLTTTVFGQAGFDTMTIIGQDVGEGVDPSGNSLVDVTAEGTTTVVRAGTTFGPLSTVRLGGVEHLVADFRSAGIDRLTVIAPETIVMRSITVNAAPPAGVTPNGGHFDELRVRPNAPTSIVVTPDGPATVRIGMPGPLMRLISGGGATASVGVDLAAGVTYDAHQVPAGWPFSSVFGTDGDDIIITGATDDVVLSGDGADTVVTGPGNDFVLDRGSQPDMFRLGEGDDRFAVSNGPAVVDGGPGNDENIRSAHITLIDVP